nr:lipoyl(octanoyl) transferase LipB [Bacteroidota bacterium]
MKNTEVEFLDLGRVEYQKAWDIQEKLFNQVMEEKLAGKTTKNYLLFCEHDPVYTLGKSGSENNLLINNQLLKNMGVGFFKTNRGGDITYHGPGQLVGYPVLNLENFELGIRSYIDKLEGSIIESLKTFNLQGERLPGATGVWLDASVQAKVRKICAIGVRASRHVTMHGFAFNVNTDLNFFNFINPCGFTDKTVTSLEKELNKKQDWDLVKQIVRKKMGETFGFKISEMNP